MPHAARVAGIGDGREDPVRDAAAAGRAPFPDPLQQRPALPVGRPARLPVPFPLLSGLPVPFFPGQALLFLLPGFPPGLRQFPVLLCPDDPFRLGKHRPGGGHGRRQHGRMGVQRGPPGRRRAVEFPSVLPGTPLPWPRSNRAGTSAGSGPVTEGIRSLFPGHPAAHPQPPRFRHSQ